MSTNAQSIYIQFTQVLRNPCMWPVLTIVARAFVLAASVALLQDGWPLHVPSHCSNISLAEAHLPQTSLPQPWPLHALHTRQLLCLGTFSPNKNVNAWCQILFQAPRTVSDTYRVLNKYLWVNEERNYLRSSSPSDTISVKFAKEPKPSRDYLEP